MGLFDKHMVVPAYREELEYKLEYGIHVGRSECLFS